MKPNLSEFIGNTPLVELELPFSSDKLRIFAKLEMFNPGGSIKDRPALHMVSQAIQSGKINQSVHLIESSSGNLAIAMAMIAQQMKLKFTAVIDPNITSTNRALIESYGAFTELVTETDEEGGYLHTRIRRVQTLLREVPNSVWLNQYANPDNPAAHYHGAGAEIVGEMPVEPTHAFICVSTCGTIMGLTRRLREAWPKIRIIAVDIAGSVIFGPSRDRRRIPGIGASRVPEQLELSEIDEVVLVNDFESVEACRLLVREEGLLAGGSSGSVIAAIQKLAPQLPSNAVVVTVLPDRGERYLDSVYNPDWLPARERVHRPLESSHVVLRRDPVLLQNAS
ncbi:MULTISPECIES: 2,3-diaminopropionate biosynthesis protein SbnA [Rhizobium/Agrobacterium group]|uniref:2,3-diaminopropionate biosynthesis protein SbnA n=1 Tax=Rhizobium/Agrobacterium group TaxID=227290 RepID=UPI001ADBF1F8|nr:MULTISPECIES: 2,3-diaminopropionate biosynthesis protein SbnA [Rhizobium/Agrobacterium group]MBO9112748.1 2,3-diaminopropionate biosynthesis protein SbnA [Agrobacterium sp. S2/73]QXZ76233.1 2,3-diaminopropionate biosynthesis protein SbnA [Agrobacterium sp. S7/73]QYA17219.1 2,3-diaminopropionate biosynthesis protein SbnA [Rhizobium sp. AB2/73]UEQ85207.1 2,3-diaminopropionate biosynthesis protein SbnA [Rhizobium sp. AB2/73]